MHENEIGTLLLDAAFQVHKELGPGLPRVPTKLVCVMRLQNGDWL